LQNTNKIKMEIKENCFILIGLIELI